MMKSLMHEKAHSLFPIDQPPPSLEDVRMIWHRSRRFSVIGALLVLIAVIGLGVAFFFLSGHPLRYSLLPVLVLGGCAIVGVSLMIHGAQTMVIASPLHGDEYNEALSAFQKHARQGRKKRYWKQLQAMDRPPCGGEYIVLCQT